MERTVVETLERAAPDAQMNDIKALLGRMMFTGNAVHKKVRDAHSSSVLLLHMFCFRTCWHL